MQATITMNFNNIEPQEAYFYQGRWTEPDVNVFVNVLVDDASVGGWNANATNHHSIAEAMEIVNCITEAEYTWDDALAQRNLLEKRYNTFKQILEVEGVWYDRSINHVYMPNWDDVFKVNDFAKAFYHKGDLMYDRLKSLFGKDHDRSTEVINISSDGPVCWGINTVAQPLVINDSDEGEVSSPVLAGSKPPRKKLFLVDEPTATLTMDSVESNTMGKKNCQLRGKSVTGKKQLFPPIALKLSAANNTINRVVGKKESSSCASSSPVKWSLSSDSK